jgi:hypothetical protein
MIKYLVARPLLRADEHRGSAGNVENLVVRPVRSYVDYPALTTITRAPRAKRIFRLRIDSDR